MELLKFIRGSSNFDGTPVYIFADVSIYKSALSDGLVSAHSFITKPQIFAEFLVLADHLMRSAEVTMREGTHGKPELIPPSKLKRD